MIVAELEVPRTFYNLQLPNQEKRNYRATSSSLRMKKTQMMNPPMKKAREAREQDQESKGKAEERFLKTLKMRLMK